MSIRVGRRIYDAKGKFVDPEYEGYTPIRVLTKCTEYGSLGPYILADKKGRIMENLYQATKIYKKVPKVIQRSSRYDPTIIWEHDAETHIDDNGEITPEYWEWREKLENNEYAVRYRVGFHYRHKVEFSLIKIDDDTYEKLNYVEGRKRVYMPIYIKLAKRCEDFSKLLEMLKNGKKLLIIEVDGPHEEDIEYYMEKYGVKRNFIVNNTMRCTKKNLSIMLNDVRHPFGHGYCLAAALLDSFNEPGLVKKLRSSRIRSSRIRSS